MVFTIPMSLSGLSPQGVLNYLDADTITALDAYGVSRQNAPGEMLIQEGHEQPSLYIVISGAIEVYRLGSGGHEVHLANLKPGDCFGEVAIFQPDVASANVRAKEASVVWAMTAENLQAFLTDYPPAGCALLLGINMILSQRLQQAGQMIRAGSIVPGFLSVRRRLRAQAA